MPDKEDHMNVRSGRAFGEETFTDDWLDGKAMLHLEVSDELERKYAWI